MSTAPQQHTEESFLTQHAARETSLSWLNSKSLEFSAFYSQREVAVKSGDPEKVLAAERALDARRVELIHAISAELHRVAQLGGPPLAQLHPEEEQHQEEQSEEARAAKERIERARKAAAERQARHRARQKA